MAKHNNNKTCYNRSSNYRQAFFSKNKARRYHCAYCGRRLKEEDVEVDHLIPVGAVKNKFLPRILLRLSGVSDVNDEKNLVASCRKCNRKKSDKLGVWLFRGMIGRHKTIWVIRYLFRACLFVGLGWLLWYGLRDSELAAEVLEAIRRYLG